MLISANYPKLDNVTSQTAVSVSGTGSKTLLAFSNKRLGAIIYNSGGQTAYINYGSSVNSASGCVAAIAAGTSYSLSSGAPCWVGQVVGYAPASTGTTLVVTDLSEA